jgi:hypothetical protein
MSRRFHLPVIRWAAPGNTEFSCYSRAGARQLDKSDQRLMTKRVGVALRGQRENGLVRCDQGPGQYMLWEIAR